MLDDETRELILGFKEEAAENLEAVSSALNDWVNGDKTELINIIFRGIHSVKGASGMFDFSDLANYAHKFENLLDKMRKDSALLESADVSFLHLCNDQMQNLLDLSIDNALGGDPTSGLYDDQALLQLKMMENLLGSPNTSAEQSKESMEIEDLVAAMNEEQERPLEMANGFNPVEVAPVVEAKEAKEAKEKPTKETSKGTADDVMRIDRKLIDKTFNLSGELLVAANSLEVLIRKVDGAQNEAFRELKGSIEKVGFLARQVQRNLMSARMVAIKTVLGKIPRIVRDLSAKLGKKVELEFKGEDTQVDKAISEQLIDPLVHLVRNSLDHGLETPADRLSLGKPDAGTLEISAKFDSGVILIEISDDGRGINRDIVFQKAAEKGLVRPEDRSTLSDRQILELLFAPGFSTAAVISDVSGRGVGLDVVRSNVSAFGGQVMVESEFGKWTKFTLALPLTTGIKEALVVKSSNQIFAIPIEQVLETVKVNPEMIFDVASKPTIKYRGEMIGYTHLQNLTGEFVESERYFLKAVRRNLPTALIFRNESQKLAVVVDEIVSKQQILLKPIPAAFKNNPIFQASSYLSNGEAILILDVINYMASRNAA